jgi:hypothetical protein
MASKSESVVILRLRIIAIVLVFVVGFGVFGFFEIKGWLRNRLGEDLTVYVRTSVGDRVTEGDTLLQKPDVLTTNALTACGYKVASDKERADVIADVLTTKDGKFNSLRVLDRRRESLILYFGREFGGQRFESYHPDGPFRLLVLQRSENGRLFSPHIANGWGSGITNIAGERSTDKSMNAPQVFVDVKNGDDLAGFVYQTVLDAGCDVILTRIGAHGIVRLSCKTTTIGKWEPYGGPAIEIASSITVSPITDRKESQIWAKSINTRDDSSITTRTRHRDGKLESLSQDGDRAIYKWMDEYRTAEQSMAIAVKRIEITK